MTVWLSRKASVGRGPDQNTSQIQVLVRFWLLGLLNNAAYVIMLAGADEISSGAVGLVYFCAIFPTILVKLTGPYWFHLVSYKPRMWAVALLMLAAYTIVALSSSLGPQLAGVALVALQGGLGEASVLALCARYPGRSSLTAWSSGTGFAGVSGYTWVALLHGWLRLSLRATLLAANGTAVLWLLVAGGLLAGEGKPGAGGDYSRLEELADDSGSQPCSPQPLDNLESTLEMGPPPPPRPSSCQPALEQVPLAAPAASPPAMAVVALEQQLEPRTCSGGSEDGGCNRRQLPGTCAEGGGGGSCGSFGVGSDSSSGSAGEMSARERLHATLALWPYMVPLFLVYVAEYMQQSGTWTAIGFPLNSPEARASFYLAANWCYQAGVFLSRSSGTLWTPGRRTLWAMPALQLCLLVFFAADAVAHWWYGPSLLVLCFAAGLLGGAVYVNAFTLLAAEVAPARVEFSLAAASVADSLGIAVADAAAVLLQGCLFRWNHIAGAAFACGGGAGMPGGAAGSGGA